MVEFLKTAIVIDNEDPDKLGRIKLRVLPEFNGVDDSLLDWCRPYLLEGNGIQDCGTHNVPEIGEYVKVIIRDRFWKKIEYIPYDYVDGFYPYSKWEEISSNMSELESMTYPQPKYMRRHKDGSINFHNSETGESGTYNKNGSYTIFISDGQYIIKSNTGITISGDDVGKIKFQNNNSDLKEILTNVLNALKDIYTPGNIIGNLGAPCIVTTANTDLPNINKSITDLGNLLDS